MHRRALASTLTTTIAANLPAFLLGGLAVQVQDELGFGTAGVGVAIGAFFAVGALSSPANGRLVDRVGPERSLRLAALLSGGLQLAIAGGARSLAVLVGLLAVAGFANAWAQPASNVVLAGVVPPDRLGLALGLQKSAIPAAALLGGLAVPAIALTAGWRWAFVAGAAFALLSALQVPRAARSSAPARRPEGRPDVPTRDLAILAVGVGLGSSASNALGAFLVLSGVEAGMGEATAGLLLTLGSIAGIGVRLLVGLRADRATGGTLTVIAAMFVVASVAFVLLAMGSVPLLVVGTPLAFATAYAWPGLFQLSVVRSNPSAPGVATGIAMTGTLSGAVAGPVVFGAVATASYAAAWLTGAGMLVVAAVIVLVSSRRIVERPVTASAVPSAPAPGI